jgi:hypothetical protein
MATTTKQMYRGAASLTSATLYTVPSATTAVVSNIIVTNTAGTAGTFTLSLNGSAIFTSTPIAANSTALFDLKQVLAATQTITGLASATSVNFHISGVEIA